MAKILGVNAPTSNADGVTKQYVDAGSSGGGSLPTGAIVPCGFASAPSGFLSCDGAAVSRATYSDLFAIIGSTFGAGDGSTTFNVPDLRDRIPIGHHPTGPGNTNTLGGSGGAFNHQHTAASHQHGMTHSHSMQSHTHNFAHTHTISHTHTMGSHSHGLRSHVHLVPGHGHSLSSVSVSSDTHSHSFNCQNVVGVNGTAEPRSSNANANRNEATSADTHTHSFSGRINSRNAAAVNGDANFNTQGPSNNSTSGISTNTTGGSTIASSGGASSTTTGALSAANTDSYTGNTDSGGNEVTTGTAASQPPYLVLHYIIKT